MLLQPRFAAPGSFVPRAGDASIAKPARNTALWLSVALIVAFIVPNHLSFSIGEFRLTPYRVVLIVGALFLTNRAFRGRLPVYSFEWLLIGYVLWTYLSFSLVHDAFRGLEAGVIFAIETLVPYYLVRTAVTSQASMVTVIKAVFAITSVLVVLGFVEHLFTSNVFIKFFNELTGTVIGGEQMRRGFVRARGTTDHAILYGLFCVSAIGMLYFMTPRFFERMRYVGVCLLGGLFSLSSGPLLVAVAQIGLIGWDVVLRRIRQRWLFLVVGIVVGLVMLELISERPLVYAVIRYIALDPQTAWVRIIQWHFGWQSVMNHPFLGIGFEPPKRPLWLTGSLDSFYLVTMVRNGLPALVLFAAFGLTLLWSVTRARALAIYGLLGLRKGVVISIVGVSVAIGTVHLWGQAHVLYFILFGLAAGLVNIDKLHDKAAKLAARQAAFGPRL